MLRRKACTVVSTPRRSPAEGNQRLDMQLCVMKTNFTSSLLVAPEQKNKYLIAPNLEKTCMCQVHQTLVSAQEKGVLPTLNQQHLTGGAVFPDNRNAREKYWLPSVPDKYLLAASQEVWPRKKLSDHQSS